MVPPEFRAEKLPLNSSIRDDDGDDGDTNYPNLQEQSGTRDQSKWINNPSLISTYKRSLRTRTASPPRPLYIFME